MHRSIYEQVTYIAQVNDTVSLPSVLGCVVPGCVVLGRPVLG